MKKIRQSLFSLVLGGISFMSTTLSAQCINTSAWGTPIAPVPGATLLAVNCQYAGEYCTVSSVVSGRTYSTASTVATDYFTVRSGSATGPVVAAGNTPLVWTANTTGSYFIHCNANAGCANQNSCRNITMGCYLPGCANTSAWGSAVAPAVTVTNVISSCNYAGEYGTVTSVVAGNVYRSSSSVGTDFFTIRSGTSNGPIVATGLTPLTWTAQVAGTHFVHVNSNSACGILNSCRASSITCIGGALPIAPVNDNCSAAITMAVNTSTGGTTLNATLESPAPPACTSAPNQPGVWYRVVGTGNQLGASLCAASGWDSKIFVYAGSCGSWNCVTNNDDNGPLCSGAAASATWCSVPTTTYFILVTGYSSPSAFTIAISQTVNASPSLALSLATNSVCPTRSTVATASGATSYSWSTGATTATVALTPSVLTVYTVTGRDASGCSASALTTTINVFPTPTISIASNTAAICPGGSFVITPTGALSYTYSGGTSTLTGLSATVSPIISTNYTINGSDGNGCRNAATAAGFASVTTLTSPSLTVVSTPTVICPGFTASLSVSGANTYTWTSLASNANALVVSPSVTTIYTVSGTGTTVCNGIRTFTLNVFAQPTIVSTPSVIASCALSTNTFSASGASTYTWNTTAIGATTTIQTPTANTVYTVAGTNASGCIGTTTIAVTSNSLPIINITPAATTICVQSFASFSAAGASTYVWNSTATGSVVNLFHSASTTHTVVGTDALGCQQTMTVAVLANPLPTVSASPSFTSVCVNTPVTFTASGALTYTWSNNQTGTSGSFTPAINSQYNVSGADANGCIGSAVISVIAKPLPTLSVAKPASTVCANTAGSYTATGAVTYTWSSGSTGNIAALTPTANTVYFVTGKDTITGCVNTQTFAVNTYSSPVMVIIPSASQSVCINASAVYSVSGANSYTWSTGISGGVLALTPTAAAVYTVSGKNQLNCIASTTVSIKLHPKTVVTVSATTTKLCVKEKVTLTATGAQTYTWMPFNFVGTTYTLSPQGTLQYTVYGTDANTCEGSDTVRVEVNKCTGIERNSALSSAISVYPNPTSGNFQVEMPFEGTKTIRVFSLSGALISVTVTNEHMQEMNLSTQAKGLYYVQIESAAGNAHYKLVVE
jgi:hypothetical protein